MVGACSAAPKHRSLTFPKPKQNPYLDGIPLDTYERDVGLARYSRVQPRYGYPRVKYRGHDVPCPDSSPTALRRSAGYWSLVEGLAKSLRVRKSTIVTRTHDR
jgi:hypothetical protein